MRRRRHTSVISKTRAHPCCSLLLTLILLFCVRCPLRPVCLRCVPGCCLPPPVLGIPGCVHWSVRTPVYDESAAASYCCRGSSVFAMFAARNQIRRAHSGADASPRTTYRARVRLRLPGAQERPVSHGAPCTPFPDRVPRARSPGPGFGAVAVPARSPGLSEVSTPRRPRRASQERPHAATKLSLGSHCRLGRTPVVDSTG